MYSRKAIKKFHHYFMNGSMSLRTRKLKTSLSLSQDTIKTFIQTMKDLSDLMATIITKITMAALTTEAMTIEMAGSINKITALVYKGAVCTRITTI